MSKTTIIAPEGSLEVITERVFQAPRERVFAAYTDAKSIPQWWGPRSLTTTVEKLEPRAGGQWRFVQRDQAGNVYAFHGVFHACVAPERLVQTFEFEGAPGAVLLETVRFESVAGGTKISGQSIFPSLDARNGMMEHGMTEGLIETWDRFEELLQKSL
jgi:uncharacterized protein YndB with AHSA1/START domain